MMFRWQRRIAYIVWELPIWTFLPIEWRSWVAERIHITKQGLIVKFIPTPMCSLRKVWGWDQREGPKSMLETIYTCRLPMISYASEEGCRKWWTRKRVLDTWKQMCRNILQTDFTPPLYIWRWDTIVQHTNFQTLSNPGAEGPQAEWKEDVPDEALSLRSRSW